MPEEKTNTTADATTEEKDANATADATIEEKDADATADDADKEKTILTGKDSETAKDSDATGDEKGTTETPGEFGEFSIPEGMVLDEGAMETFSPLAKEFGLTQAQAQKLVDIYSNANADAASAFSEKIDALQNGWIQEVREDEEIGGEKFDESVATARFFLNGYGDSKLIDILNETGLGSHPAIVKLFVNLGRLAKEDGTSNFGKLSGGDTPKTVATTLFPSMTKGE